MPASSDQTRLIDSQAQLDEVCEQLAAKNIIALDTEFMRTDTYYPKLCLIQLATDSRPACIDVLANLDTGRILECLVNSQRLKIFHAAKQDLEAFQLTFGQLPEPIFDTQIAAGLLGYQAQIGYANLVMELIGVRLEKGQTRTDWSRRPLTKAQLKYAGDDVLHLAELHARLRAELEAAGRYDWALEDSAELIDPPLYVARPEDAWRRMPSIPSLPIPIQARARRLMAWREARAQHIDRPRGWVLTDKALLAIAAADPRDETALKNLPDLPPAVIRKQGKVIFQELRQANGDVEGGRVDFRQVIKPGPPDAKALKNLSDVVGGKARELNISAELLTTKRDLTALLRGDRDIKVLRGWRLEVIGEPLLKIMGSDPIFS